MKITKITVENYRLLKNFSLDLEEVLSLVVGKNNTGKTSILLVLDKFLNKEKNSFYFDDFNIDFKNELQTLIDNSVSVDPETFKPIGIKLRIYIEYTSSDSLENVQQIMMDLDPENNFVVLGFEYVLSYDKLIELRTEFVKFKQEEAKKKIENDEYSEKDIFYFLKHSHQHYFGIQRKSIFYDISEKTSAEDNFIDLDEKRISIKNILNFQFISAKRDVTNKESNKTLSAQTAKIYKGKEENSDCADAEKNFNEEVMKADDALTKVYEDIFKDTVDKVKQFGGLKPGESSIKIESTLQYKELLEGNTTVFYHHDGVSLPEYYNGLGYMNLMSMIFEIEVIFQSFRKSQNEKPADINLLFIEEPEAHTHPQMQYVFIRNIKDILKEGIQRVDFPNRAIQTVITTHSAHIVSESKFEDIKYLRKNSLNGIDAKNLKTLKAIYATETKEYDFLKQYLTLNKAEIFFADKAILIEGDTERILFPAFMKKLDLEARVPEGESPLSSQHISIIEVGAYTHIFKEFIEFVGIKTLILTDLDSTREVATTDKLGRPITTRNACRVIDGKFYSNASIKNFLKKSDGTDFTLVELTTLDESKKITMDSNLFVAFQVLENGITARSFEDAFIHINRDWITNHKSSFKGLKNSSDFDDSTKDSYDLAEKCINKKTHFALDILYHSNDNFSNWEIPLYIKQGLLWLRK